jgi:sensor histidine kinase YesM
MNLHDFIFSNDRRHQLARHIAFWVGWFLFSGFVQISFNVNDSHAPKSLDHLIRYQLARTTVRLLPVSLFCYFTTYFLVPRFVRTGKFKQVIAPFFLSILSLYAISFGCLLLNVKILHLNPYILNWSSYVFFFNSFYSNINFTGAVPTCCLMLAIKYYKNWYVKQRRSEQLSRENIQAELQMLKAQVHPHFLFNTLNNIYSFVLTGDHRAAGLVDKLSGMVDYMRTEGEYSLVALEKEIKLIRDYVGLEKIRYGDRLELTVEINGEYKNKLVAPLLMIPFVENCFKHGASVMRGNQWINLKISISGCQLDFSLSNSKPKNAVAQRNKKSIGLINVKKRLQLLYPEKHSLEIRSTEDIYEVHLVLTLQEEAISDMVQKPPLLKKPAYV